MSRLSMSEAAVADHKRRMAEWFGDSALGAPFTGGTLPRAIVDTAKRVRPRKGREPNKLETEFGQTLELRKRAGEIRDYGFERITLKIAHDCRYTGDYDTVELDGRLSIWEVKGHHTWEDAWVKLKVAAAQYPHIRFHLCKKGADGTWVIREVPSGAALLERMLP